MRVWHGCGFIQETQETVRRIEEDVDRMREIKFRVWDCVNRKYMSDEQAEAYKRARFWNKKPRAIVERYTGTRDKNSVKIYKGDLLTHERNGLYMVEWSHMFDVFVVSAVRDKTVVCPLHHIYQSSIEVIGNIHENEDLLEARCSAEPYIIPVCL